MTEVAGKVAFVTGGGSGVGFGQASVFAEAGCKVAIADIRQDHLDDAMEYLAGRGYDVMPVMLDITDRDAYARAANGIKVFLPRMLERGDDCHIVNTASMSAFVSLPGTGIYCTTKMAMRGLSECLSMDLKDTNITVSMLCPGAVNTNIHEAVLTRPKHLEKTGYYGADPEAFARLKAVIEVGMEPETLAKYVLKGVEDDQLYILPYPEFRGTLEDIHARVMASLANPEDDPEYEKRVARGVPGGKT